MADSMMDAEAEAARLLQLPPDKFAEMMLTMLYFKVLHPKGIQNLTVVLDGSVFNVGTMEPLPRLERAAKLVQDELESLCSAKRNPQK